MPANRWTFRSISHLMCMFDNIHSSSVNPLALLLRCRSSESMTDLTRNERRAVDLMFRLGAITQAQLAEWIDVTQQSASRILLSLVDRGMISSGERVKVGSRGYPANSFSLVPDHCVTAGIAVAPGSMDVLVSDFAGKVIATEHLSGLNSDITETAALIGQTLDSLLNDAAGGRKPLGAGLAVSGSFLRQGVFNTPYGLDEWADIDLENYFAGKLGVPVYAENDGNAAALAECLVGAGQRYDSFAYLFVGAGVGGGIVLDGKLWRGRHGNAGEFAGGLEPTLDIFPSLEVLRLELGADGIRFETIDDLLREFDAGWPAVQRWVQKVSRSLSIIASNAGAILDIDAIILGGRLPVEMAAMVIPHIRFFDQHRRSQSRPVPHLLAAEAPAAAAAMGAALLPLQKLFH